MSVVKMKKFNGSEMKKSDELLECDLKFLNRKPDWRDYVVYEEVGYKVEGNLIKLEKKIKGCIKYNVKVS